MHAALAALNAAPLRDAAAAAERLGEAVQAAGDGVAEAVRMGVSKAAATQLGSLGHRVMQGEEVKVAMAAEVRDQVRDKLRQLVAEV